MNKRRLFVRLTMRRQLQIMAGCTLIALLYALALQWLIHTSVGFEYMFLTWSCAVPAIVMALTADEGLQLGLTRRDLWGASVVCSGIQGLLFAGINTVATLLLSALHIQAYGMVLFTFNNQIWTSLLGGLLVGSLCGLIGVSAWFVLRYNIQWGAFAVMMLMVLFPIVITVPGLLLATQLRRVSLAYVMGFMAIMFGLNVLVGLVNRRLFRDYQVQTLLKKGR